MNVALCNYPCQKQTLVKWSEVDAIQIFVEHWRGDLRPPITLAERRQQHLHCDDITNKFDEVGGSVIQTLELALAFEKERSRILRKKVAAIEAKEAKEALKIDDEKEAMLKKEFSKRVDEELAHKKMSKFAYETDLSYRWHGWQLRRNPVSGVGYP